MVLVNLSDDLAFTYYDLCRESNLIGVFLLTHSSLVTLDIGNSVTKTKKALRKFFLLNPKLKEKQEETTSQK